MRLPVKTYKREELARLTGIPASDLSALNSGNKPMTLGLAKRIADAVPGVSVSDLQPPGYGDVSEDDIRSLLLRMQELLAETLGLLAREEEETG